MLEPMQITLNVDKIWVRQSGVDPDTSEGKAKIKELLLEALDHYGDQHGEELEEGEFALLQSLLGEKL